MITMVSGGGGEVRARLKNMARQNKEKRWECLSSQLEKSYHMD